MQRTRSGTIANDRQDDYMEQLDTAALDQLKNLKSREDQEPLLNRLIDLYGGESPRLFNEMLAARDTGDLETITDCAHILKSSSAQLGALEFSGTCKSIETLASDGSDVGQLNALIDTASTQLQIVIEQLEGERI